MLFRSVLEAALLPEWKGPDMTTDAVRGLVDLAGVVTGAGVDRAKDAMRTLLTVALEVLDNPAAAGARFGDAARDHINDAGESRDDATADLSERIRAEVDRVAARFGFVREEELAAVRARVQRLETQLAEFSRVTTEGTNGNPVPAKPPQTAPRRSSASSRRDPASATKSPAASTRKRAAKPSATTSGKSTSATPTRRGKSA